MNRVQHNFINRMMHRPRLLRRIMIILSFIALLAGLQSYAHYKRLESNLDIAAGQFAYLADEKQNSDLTVRITNTLSQLRTLSSEVGWQSDLEEIQSEFEGFVAGPGKGMDVILDRVNILNNKATMGKEILDQLRKDLIQLEIWHHDYYGDIIASITAPGLLYWPTSVLLEWHYSNTILDTMQFNRALYLILIGEVSAGQAILGELRTQLPDSQLRARVMFTQGRLLYGIGRYDESVEVVTDSIQMNPEYSLARKFLDYQLSRGPDEEVEEEDESVQNVGTASSGEATLF